MIGRAFPIVGLVLLAACADPAPPADEGPPTRLAGSSLRRRIPETEARDSLRRLIGAPVSSLSAAWGAEYGDGGLTVYRASTVSREVARELVDGQVPAGYDNSRLSVRRLAAEETELLTVPGHGWTELLYRDGSVLFRLSGAPTRVYTAWGGLLEPAISEEPDQPASGAEDMLRIDLGTIGPALLTAGVIDLERLEDVYTRQGHPLAPQEREILEQGTDTTVVLDSGNARFLLDLLWGLGLANRNRLLHEGPMMEAGGGRVDRYASTGGWRYARRPLSEIYGGFAVVPLTPEQEAWVGTAAFAVYRPCCNNPTALPDCNHGMAMLGLFTLLANRGASVEEMLDAAYLASAAWFPYQTGEVSHFLSAALGVRRAAAVRSLASGPDLFSATGYRAVQAWLSKNGMAPVASGGVVSAC